MAWAVGATSGARGTTNNKVSGTSISVTVANNDIIVGDIAVAWFSGDSIDTTADSNHLSISDSAGNTWVKVRELQGTAGAAADVVTAVWMTKITAQLSIGATITFTIGTAIVAKAAGCSVFTVAAGKTWQVANGGGAGNAQEGANSAGNQTYTSPASDTLSSIERLWLGFVGHEGRTPDSGNDTDYAVTTASGSSGAPIDGNATGRLNYRIATLTGDTFDGTLSNPVLDYVAHIIAVDEIDDGAPATATPDPIIVPSAAAHRAANW